MTSSDVFTPPTIWGGTAQAYTALDTQVSTMVRRENWECLQTLGGTYNLNPKLAVMFAQGNFGLNGNIPDRHGTTIGLDVRFP